MQTNIIPESGVPIPQKLSAGRKSRFPTLLLGESFFIAGTKYPWMSVDGKRQGHRYTMRKTVENGIAGIRVWRVA